MNLGNFFAEMRRRSVYKVAVAYAIVGWLVIQIATQTFPFLQIPNWCVRLIIVAILLGFPIALILAWAYEMTPEGIKREEGCAGGKIRHTPERRQAQCVDDRAPTRHHWVSHFPTIPSQRRLFRADGKSIAVLPFDNFSDDKENAFFADGIQDDILTSLAKIHDLKVISRTSVMPYRGAAKIICGKLRRPSAWSTCWKEVCAGEKIAWS